MLQNQTVTNFRILRIISTYKLGINTVFHEEIGSSHMIFLASYIKLKKIYIVCA